MLLQSNNSIIGGGDIAYFFPSDFSFDKDVVLDGNVEGNMEHLEGHGFRLRADSIIDIHGNFEINSLNNIDELSFNVNLKDLSVDIVEVAAYYNELVPNKPIDVSSFKHWDKISYRGAITGLRDHFNTNGE